MPFTQQVDDLEEGQEVEPRKQKSKKTKEKERPFSVETKYKGYEELLDVDEDDSDILIPRDVQGSVRALNYALAHPLIFSESHGTYKERRVKKEKVIYMLILWYKHLGKANSESPVFRVVRALNYRVSQKFVAVRYKSVLDLVSKSFKQKLCLSN